MAERKGGRYFQVNTNKTETQSSSNESEGKKKKQKRLDYRFRLAKGLFETKSNRQLKLERKIKGVSKIKGVGKKERSPHEKMLRAAIRGDLPPEHLDIPKKEWTQALAGYAQRMKSLSKPLQILSNKERELVELEIMARNRGWTTFPIQERKVCYLCGLENIIDPNQCPNCSPFSEEHEKKSIYLCFRCGSTTHTFDECKILYRDLKQEYKNVNISCLICKEKGHVNCKHPNIQQRPCVSCARCGATEHFYTNCTSTLPPIRKRKKSSDTLKFIDDADLRVTPVKNVLAGGEAAGSSTKERLEHRWFLRPRKIDPVLSPQS